MVADIFPSLYTQWDAEKGNFSPEAQMKLAIVEENSTLDKDQYKLLKKYSGSRDLTVNIKYKPEYKVRNNLNVILISNEEIPMYVETSEAPSDPLNNQFFVYKFEKLETEPDPLFQQKLQARLGHYVQTELRRVFTSLDIEQGRYGIPVPITKWERELFANNKTVLDDVTESVCDALLEALTKHLKGAKTPLYWSFNDVGLELLQDKVLTVKAIKACELEGYRSHNVVKQLIRKGLIKSKGIKKYSYGEEFRGYQVESWPELDEVIRKYGSDSQDDDPSDIFN